MRHGDEWNHKLGTRSSRVKRCPGTHTEPCRRNHQQPPPCKKYKTGDPAAGAPLPSVLPFASKPPYFLPTLRVYGNELCPPRTSAECKICNTTALPSLSLFLSLWSPSPSPSAHARKPRGAAIRARKRARISCVEIDVMILYRIDNLLLSSQKRAKRDRIRG